MANIQSITISGQQFTPDTNGNVTIPIPSKTSDLMNDSGFITNEVDNLAYYLSDHNTYAKLDAINEFMSISSMLGIDAWKASKAYTVGQYVMCGDSGDPSNAGYRDKIYRCKTAHTSSSTFDASKWDKLNLVEYLREVLPIS